MFTNEVMCKLYFLQGLNKIVFLLNISAIESLTSFHPLFGSNECTPSPATAKFLVDDIENILIRQTFTTYKIYLRNLLHNISIPTITPTSKMILATFNAMAPNVTQLDLYLEEIIVLQIKDTKETSTFHSCFQRI